MTRIRPEPTPANPIAVALDIDGTFASSHLVSDYAISVISQLEAVGVRPFFVTGRHEANVMNLSKRAGLTSPFVACNGALVMDSVTGEILESKTMDEGLVREIYEFCKGTIMTPIIFTADAIYVDPGWMSEILEIANDIRPLHVAWEDLPMNQALKIMIAVPPEEMPNYLPAIMERFPMMQYAMPELVEAPPEGADKATSLPIVLDAMGIPADRCVGFGDSENDAGWMQLVGWRVAPRNALPEVRAAADEIIGPNTEDSVARYLEKHFLKG